MNKIETYVYNIVRKNPALKQFVRNTYQSIFDFLPKKKEFFFNKPDYREGYFFGFHDVTPFSFDERKILANKLSFDLRMPKANEALAIGYFDFYNGKFGQYHKMGTSFAWNYHKGCRLQWLDKSKIIFNSAENGKLCSVIMDLINNSSTNIPYPIDAVYKNMATSFSYERLERCMPGYGYPYKDEGMLDEAAPEKTGLFLVSLESGDRKMLLSIKEIAQQVVGHIEKEYLHFVTHTEFSTDGRFISFLYRRIPITGDYMKRRSVICIYDLVNNELLTLPSQESGSHYVWNHKNQIIASCFMDGQSCHTLFELNDLESPQKIDELHLNSDGHQSFVTDNVFVTDTYPDKSRMADIFMTDIGKNRSKLIASLYSPKKFQTKDFKCHIACDLHPRVSPSGQYVCFDSPRSGKRGLYVMKLP